MRWHNIGDFTKNNVKDKDSFQISVVVQQLCAMFINYKDIFCYIWGRIHINLSRVEAQNTSFNVAEQSSYVSVMRKNILFSNEMFYILKLFS